MAISEVCKFELKSMVDKVQKEKSCSRNKALSFVANECDIPVETARKKDQRARKELGQNVPSQQTTENIEEKKEKCQKTERGSYDDWRKLKELSEAVKLNIKEMRNLKVDSQHLIPARSLCESLADKFNRLAQKLVG